MSGCASGRSPRKTCTVPVEIVARVRAGGPGRALVQGFWLVQNLWRGQVPKDASVARLGGERRAVVDGRGSCDRFRNKSMEPIGTVTEEGEDAEVAEDLDWLADFWHGLDHGLIRGSSCKPLNSKKTRTDRLRRRSLQRRRRRHPQEKRDFIARKACVEGEGVASLEMTGAGPCQARKLGQARPARPSAAQTTAADGGRYKGEGGAHRGVIEGRSGTSSIGNRTKESRMLPRKCEARGEKFAWSCDASEGKPRNAFSAVICGTFPVS